MVKIKVRTRNTIIILIVIVLASLISLTIMNYYEKGKTDKEEQIMYLSLQQAENEFNLELNVDTHEGISDVKDLNTLLEPTSATDVVLKRWEFVHDIDPEYPYPEEEIKERDWMGLNQFLHGEDPEDEGNKPDMIYDENMNIDSDVFDYIMSGTTGKNKDHPTVKEAEERMEEEYFSDSSLNK